MWGEFWGEGRTIEAHHTLKSYCTGEQGRQFLLPFTLVGNTAVLSSICLILYFLSPLCFLSFNLSYFLFLLRVATLIYFCERKVPPLQEWPIGGEPISHHTLRFRGLLSCCAHWEKACPGLLPDLEALLQPGDFTRLVLDTGPCIKWLEKCRSI